MFNTFKINIEPLLLVNIIIYKASGSKLIISLNPIILVHTHYLISGSYSNYTTMNTKFIFHS